MRSARSRAVWAVPVLTAGVVVAAGALTTATSASAHPTLPARTAAQLLAGVQTSDVSILSGTVVESTHLGLPSLPGADGGSSLSWQSLVTGSHTARVWVAGPDKQRVALLGTLSESDVIHNGTDLWTYTSQTNQVTHTVLSAKDSRHAVGSAVPDARSVTPLGAAQQLLKAIDPTTAVSVDPTRTVAGRPAYTIVLTPRDTRSTVRKVAIAIDATHFVPLEVQVFGSGSTAAFDTRFTKGLSFATPKASIFDFHPPAGSTIAPNPLRAGRRVHVQGGPGGPTPRLPAATSTSAPKIIGTGWTSIAEFATGLPDGATGALLDKLAAPIGSNGDRIVKTALLNVLIQRDGRAFLGAVSASMLEQTAAATPR
ncbi:MAG: LolA family protein [Jatrophihabitantaceae bacterium]